MTNHQKRLAVPKSWPVERKTEKYTVKADAGPHGEDGVPLVVVLRDVLGYVDSAKEARYALEQDSVLINGDAVSDFRRPVGMFDILGFAEREEHYRVFPGEGGRLALTPIDADAAGSKLGKVVGKRQIDGGRTQVNLHDGKNLLFDDAVEYEVNDSLVIDNDDDSVVAHFPYEDGALVTAIRGSHAGEVGEISEIEVALGSGPNSVTFESGDQQYETLEKYVVVIDENFTDDDGSQEDAAEDAGEEPDGDQETDDDADEGGEEE
jgi:small subunit ribosomal protein S4e